jgi:hypothetical protein
MGKVNLPKIFRRQVQYEVSKAAGITDQSSLRTYLETQKKDVCYTTTEFFNKGEESKKNMFATFIDQDGKINFAPRFSIYRKGVKLKDANGEKIDKWY